MQKRAPATRSESGRGQGAPKAVRDQESANSIALRARYARRKLVGEQHVVGVVPASLLRVSFAPGPSLFIAPPLRWVLTAPPELIVF
jgi:hypothetical protein